jgi:hypothetical protein
MTGRVRTATLVATACAIVLAVTGSAHHFAGAATPAAPAAPAAPRRMIGVSANPASARDLAAVRALGVREIRWTLYWKNYLDTRRFASDRSTPIPTGGITVPQMFDADYRAAKAAGLDQLIVIHTPPTGMTLQQGMSAMPSFVAARAREYPGTTWQILNEMDGEDAFNGGWFNAKARSVTQYQRGRSYGSLLAAVATAARRADPTARIVAGGIALEPSEFLRGMWETCSPSLLTAVAVHAYGRPSILQFRSKGIAARDAARGVPVWITEFGSRLPTETLQRADLAADFADYDANHRYDRAYLYSLSSQDGYGVMSPSGTLRSAANLLRNRTAP